MSLNWQPVPLKPFEMPIDTYIYHEEKNSPIARPTLDKSIEDKTAESKLGIEKPQPKQQRSSNQSSSESVSLGKGEQNINLNIKSKNSMDKPLLDILTKATAAHLVYPKIAVDFHLTGTVIVEFTISPDGKINDIAIAKSSGNEVLDKEAIDAISAASPLKNVSSYLEKTEAFYFQIVFG
ncbi:MAG: energy transducer TonB [Gammaproteobacteria bacterium]